jgi:hypothetical protein
LGFLVNPSERMGFIQTTPIKSAINNAVAVTLSPICLWLTAYKIRYWLDFVRSLTNIVLMKCVFAIFLGSLFNPKDAVNLVIFQ